MSLWDTVIDTLFVALGASWFGLMFAALSTFSVGVFFKVKDSVEDEGTSEVRWISIGLIGGPNGGNYCGRFPEIR